MAKSVRATPVVGAFLRIVLAAVAGLALWQLLADERGIRTETLTVGETPVRVYRAGGSAPAPLVLVAHGFAGSRRLMEPVALALAGRGYVAATFDFLGHGSHPRPLRADLQDQNGTPTVLVRQTARVVDGLQGLAGTDGRLAVVGHSMATNILVRYAQEHPEVAATVTISMFAPTVDSVSPTNLLTVPGEWEGRLIDQGRRAVAMVTDTTPEAVEPFTTYGSLEEGTARRLAIAPHVEHIGVLYSATMLDETVAWLDAVFGRAEAGDPVRGHGRGLWILLFMTAVFLLARPLLSSLPRVRTEGPPPGADAPWKRLWLVAGVPALLTPLVLRPLPTGFLPVVVADYMAVHFLTFGVLTAGLLWWTSGRPGAGKILALAGTGRGNAGRILAGAGLMTAFFLVGVAWPLDRFFTAFFPVPPRIPVLLAILAGTLPYFLADEWLTRGDGARRGAYAFTKTLFLLSLVLAVALDFEGLFFLVLIVPMILAFFVVHGLFSRWAYRATGSPLVAGLANALAFAWALAVTFPLYAGN